MEDKDKEIKNLYEQLDKHWDKCDYYCDMLIYRDMLQKKVNKSKNKDLCIKLNKKIAEINSKNKEYNKGFDVLHDKIQEYFWR